MKGEHERQFAYEAHTACDKNGFVLGVEVTAGNVHDSVAWDKVYYAVTAKHEVKFVTMDAGYNLSPDFVVRHTHVHHPQIIGGCIDHALQALRLLTGVSSLVSM